MRLLCILLVLPRTIETGSYTLTAQALHWLAVLLILMILPVAWVMMSLPTGPEIGCRSSTTVAFVPAFYVRAVVAAPYHLHDKGGVDDPRRGTRKFDGSLDCFRSRI
jgi:hypothetical protein